MITREVKPCQGIRYGIYEVLSDINGLYINLTAHRILMRALAKILNLMSTNLV